MEEKDMEYRIATISGDGIGPEIVREAKKVLDKTGQKYGHKFNYEESSWVESPSTPTVCR